MIDYLKSRFGRDNVKKIFYFSDGAGSQYKNRFNLSNLANHVIDHNVEAEWNFFATSHGKGACDGVGGTVKRHAKKSSLQSNDPITSAEKLFNWAKSFFKKISFFYCTSQQHAAHDELREPRFSEAKAIKDTMQFHFFSATRTTDKLECKLFSNDTNVVIKKI